MWDIVWVSPQGHRSVSVSRHFLLQAPQCPCSVRKRFSRDHCCRGRSKPGCWIVGLHIRWEFTTWADFKPIKLTYTATFYLSAGFNVARVERKSQTHITSTAQLTYYLVSITGYIIIKTSKIMTNYRTISWRRMHIIELGKIRHNKL